MTVDELCDQLIELIEQGHSEQQIFLNIAGKGVTHTAELYGVSSHNSLISLKGREL